MELNGRKLQFVRCKSYPNIGSMPSNVVEADKVKDMQMLEKGVYVLEANGHESFIPFEHIEICRLKPMEKVQKLAK